MENIIGDTVVEIAIGDTVEVRSKTHSAYDGFRARVSDTDPSNNQCSLTPLSDRPDGHGLATFHWEADELFPVEKVSRLIDKIEQLRSEVEQLRVTKEDTRLELNRAVQRHTDDVETIGQRLIEECEQRDWCSEFDEIVDSLNTQLHYGLPARTRDWNVEVEVVQRTNITLSGRTPDDVAQLVSQGDVSYEIEMADLHIESVEVVGVEEA